MSAVPNEKSSVVKHSLLEKSLEKQNCNGNTEFMTFSAMSETWKQMN